MSQLSQHPSEPANYTSDCHKLIYEGRPKVILMLQVSNHDFELLVLIDRVLPDQPKKKTNHQTFDK